MDFTLEIGIPKDKIDTIVYSTPDGQSKSMRQVLGRLMSMGVNPLWPIIENQHEIREYIQRGVFRNLTYGERGIRSMLYDYGRKWVRQLQNYIVGIKSPLTHLKPSTIKARKAKQKKYPSYYTYPYGIEMPLVETGTLLGSFGFKITELNPRYDSEGRPFDRFTSGRVGRPSGARDSFKRQRISHKDFSEALRKLDVKRLYRNKSLPKELKNPNTKNLILRKSSKGLANDPFVMAYIMEFVSMCELVDMRHPKTIEEAQRYSPTLVVHKGIDKDVALASIDTHLSEKVVSEKIGRGHNGEMWKDMVIYRNGKRYVDRVSVDVNSYSNISESAIESGVNSLYAILRELTKVHKMKKDDAFKRFMWERSRDMANDPRNRISQLVHQRFIREMTRFDAWDNASYNLAVDKFNSKESQDG